jgi:hypothetical protein
MPDDVLKIAMLGADQEITSEWLKLAEQSYESD